MELIAEDRKQDVSVCMCSGHPFVAVTVFQNKRNIAFVRKQVLSYFRVFAKGRLQLLLITTIVWMSPYVKFTHKSRKHLRNCIISYSSCACFEIHDSQRVSVDPVILSNVMVMTIMWYLSSYAEKTVF